jgi:hypothetical protein
MKKICSKSVQGESSVLEIKKNKGKEELNDISVGEKKAPSSTDKGNLDKPFISDAPDACKKLGLEDLNEAIDSTEKMDVDAGNETNINESVGQEPDGTDARKNVGPDVETSLGQPSNSMDFPATDGADMQVNVETDPHEVEKSDKSVDNVVSENESESEEVSKETDEDSSSENKDKDKVEASIEEEDSNDIPLADKLCGKGVTKKLRSNKGVAVTSTGTNPKTATISETETPRSQIKSTGVGPKKSRSKVKVKTTGGTSRKRKVITSSESDYDVEEDVPNITTTGTRKSVGKKTVQTVENVPIDKVSFHLPEFAQRWKFIYHRRVAVERELSEETVRIKEIMDLIKRVGLIKTVCNLGDCYEKLVSEFIVNIPEDCDNPLSKEFQKVYVRGECVNFSPNIINKFWG